MTPITWGQQGKEINQMPSQMPAEPAIAVSIVPSQTRVSHAG